MSTNNEFASNFIDYAHVLVKRRWTIIKIVTFLVVLTIVITLVMAKTYTSTSIIMVPKSDSELGVSSLSEQISLADLAGLGDESGDAKSLLAILSSRTLNSNTVKEFNLDERWESDYFEDAIEELREKSNFELEEDGSIVIDVSMETDWLATEEEEKEASQLAADVTNFMVSELDRINKRLKSQWARDNRVFIEGRYNEAKNALTDLENEFREYMESTGTVAIQEQTEAAVTIASQIKAEIILAQVDLEVMESSLGKVNPEVQKLQRKIKSFEDQLLLMKYGESSEEDSMSMLSSLRVYPIFKDVPELAVNFRRLEREFMVQGGIYTFLTEQYEQARIREARDTPTLQVLDMAVPHERRSSPQRALTVIMVTILSLIAAVGYVFFLELIEHTTKYDARSATTLESIKSHIRSDLNYIRKDRGN